MISVARLLNEQVCVWSPLLVRNRRGGKYVAVDDQMPPRGKDNHQRKRGTPLRFLSPVSLSPAAISVTPTLDHALYPRDSHSELLDVSRTYPVGVTLPWHVFPPGLVKLRYVSVACADPSTRPKGSWNVMWLREPGRVGFSRNRTASSPNRGDDSSSPELDDARR
jgi:hypothetical protein